MKPLSLLALYEGFRALPEELLAAYEAQLSEREEPLRSVKSHEAASVVALVDALHAHGAEEPRLFEGFVFSFRIPQISSEFDLLKITADAVVNVELKSESVGAARMGRQLVRNRYYLAPLERRIHAFTYVVSEDALYELVDDRARRGGTPSGPNGVARVGIERLHEVLQETGEAYEGVVEDLFKVSNYLVSPLNDTQRFLEGSYFLTNHQAQIKAAFLHACADTKAGVTRESPAFVVYGSAGTGKTLLLYDLARTLAQTCRVCVIHCGVLSEGHEALNRSQEGFRVIAAKHSEREDFRGYGAILIDEAQRMWSRQLAFVAGVATEHGIPLYLSLDRRQVLSAQRKGLDPQGVLGGTHARTTVFELSRKIRTNRELADFIRALFGLRGAPRIARTRHVKVGFARDARGARTLVDARVAEGYQFIALATATGARGEGAEKTNAADGGQPLEDVLVVPGCPTPSLVIGQEFDKVVMAVGPSFTFGEQGSLAAASLFQGLTRARDDIALVVYDNEEMLRHVLFTLGVLDS